VEIKKKSYCSFFNLLTRSLNYRVIEMDGYELFELDMKGNS